MALGDSEAMVVDGREVVRGKEECCISRTVAATWLCEEGGSRETRPRGSLLLLLVSGGD